MLGTVEANRGRRSRQMKTFFQRDRNAVQPPQLLAARLPLVRGRRFGKRLFKPRADDGVNPRVDGLDAFDEGLGDFDGGNFAPRSGGRFRPRTNASDCSRLASREGQIGRRQLAADYSDDTDTDRFRRTSQRMAMSVGKSSRSACRIPTNRSHPFHPWFSAELLLDLL